MRNEDEVAVLRVNLSLPCTVPVLPGTQDTDAPIEQRTERCAVDAWWVVGRAFICTHHLRQIMPDVIDGWLAEGHDLSAIEVGPWSEMHRYDQATATPEWA